MRLRLAPVQTANRSLRQASPPGTVVRVTAPAGPWAPAPPTGSQVRPGAGRFVIAGAIAVVGIVVAVVLVVRTVLVMTDTVEGFDRVEVPGEMVVDVASSGGYTIYAERYGVADGFRPFVRAEVTPEAGGTPLVLRPYDANVTYDVGSYEGVGVYSVRVDEPGRYRIVVDGPPGTTAAFGRGVGGNLARGLIAAFAVGGLGVLAGGVLAIVTGVQRGRSRRALLAANQPWGGGPPAGGPWAPPAWPGSPSTGRPPPPPPPPPPSGFSG
jgi:hypothetical protein